MGIDDQGRHADPLEACAAVLHYAAEAAGRDDAERASAAIYEAVTATSAAGVRTHDLGGAASTTEVVDAVIDRVRSAVAA